MLCRCLLGVATFCCLIGCSNQPTAIDVPPINPAEATAAAFAQYDANSDSQLSRNELTACAALAGAVVHYDKNDDDQISAEELTSRFAGWVESGIGVSSLACRVTLKNRPLVGAKIVFIPEACFGNTLQPATGITDDSGTAMLSVDEAYLPKDAHNMRGVQQGLYRVEVTHPQERIPAKYNSATRLGKEVSFEIGENFIRFDL